MSREKLLDRNNQSNSKVVRNNYGTFPSNETYSQQFFIRNDGGPIMEAVRKLYEFSNSFNPSKN